ncbi:MAG: SMI1/KNR4 family protein [Limnothrix sp.]
MFDWLKEINDLCNAISSQRKYYGLMLADQGATKTELQQLETQLGISLAPSHRNFLQQWNGMTLNDWHILSTTELLEWKNTAGFAPFDGEVTTTSESIDPDVHLYYASKPAYHLVFCTFDLTGEVLCLDGRSPDGSEYPVCRYDAEYYLEDHLAIKFPSFEAMLLKKVFDFVVEDTAELISESAQEFSEAEENKLLQQFDFWALQLKEIMTKRGAMVERYSIDWSQWQS